MKPTDCKNRRIFLLSMMIAVFLFGISLPVYGAENSIRPQNPVEAAGLPGAGIAYEEGTEPLVFAPKGTRVRASATSGEYYGTEWSISGPAGDYTLTLSGDTVSLNAGAFEQLGYHPDDVTHIVVRDGTSAISSGGLWHYHNLQSVELPDSLTEIGSNAFLGCLSLMEVKIPEHVREVGTSAFQNTGDLRRIEFPDAMDDTEEGRLMIAKAIYDGSFCETVDGVDQFAASVERADRILADLNLSGKTEYEKVEAIYHWITSNITYDYEAAEADWSAPDKQGAVRYDQSIYGGLFHGKAVCGGYARVAYLLFNRAGISCVFMLSEEHAWNLVKIGDLYYEIDSTWDSETEPEAYRYFLWDKAYFDTLDFHTSIQDYTPTFYQQHPIAQRQTEGDYEYLIVHDMAKITHFNNTAAGNTLTIASSLGGCPVTELPSHTFEGLGKIREIIIPEGIERIGAAFEDCENLRKLKLPASLKKIDESAFYWGLFPENITIEYAGTCAQYEELASHTHNAVVLQASSITCSDGRYEYPYQIEKCSIEIDQTRSVYSGKPFLPVPQVIFDGERLTPGVDYEVEYEEVYGVGTGYGYVYGIGQFTGFGNFEFQVVPGATKLTKLKAGKKKITVKWKKQTEATKGYQIQIATNSTFKKGVKKYKVKNKNTASYVIKGLKSKKTYFVRVRTYGYDEMNDGSIYSDWSNVKKVRVK